MLAHSAKWMRLVAIYPLKKVLKTQWCQAFIKVFHEVPSGRLWRHLESPLTEEILKGKNIQCYLSQTTVVQQTSILQKYTMWTNREHLLVFASIEVLYWQMLQGKLRDMPPSQDSFVLAAVDNIKKGVLDVTTWSTLICRPRKQLSHFHNNIVTWTP